MKVGLNFNIENTGKNVPFEGFKVVKDSHGFRRIAFAYPHNEDNEEVFIEIYKLDQDSYNNYYATGRAYDRENRRLHKLNGKPIDMTKEFGIADNQAFAYHYVIIGKDGKEKVRLDMGDILDESKNRGKSDKDIYNIVHPNKSNISRGGNMKLVIVDSQHVGRVYNDQNVVTKDPKLEKRGLNGIKTITNKFGGTLAGLEYAIDKGEYENYNRIISLPIFTDDDFTAHSYWNKNCMQMSSSLGNINNYASLQRKMFAHGMNFVSDGAFVNEGLMGVHFSHILKWGEDSPYLNWFRADGIKDSPLSMGVFVKNKDFISHKIVNSPYSYIQKPSGKIAITKNQKYESDKPTYIQFFDTRLVSEEDRKDTSKLIKTYEKMSTDNIYDLHSHNDSVFPYYFEINPKYYNDNIKRLNAFNSTKDMGSVIKLSSPEAARILSKFDTFVVDGKFEGGFETWDANPDIAKLNFVPSSTDTKALKNIDPKHRKEYRKKIERGNYQVQDYAIESGKYWTRKTADILRVHIAQNLKEVDAKNPEAAYKMIVDKSNNEIFPLTAKTEVTSKQVKNVLSNLYMNEHKFSTEDTKSQIIEGLMNTPLDSIEFGDNIVGVLASPLISKRASVKKDIGVSRYELFKSGDKNLPEEYKNTYQNTNDMFTHEMYDFAKGVLDIVNDRLDKDNKLYEGNHVTEYGQYVLPIIVPQIAKFAVIKSLAPKTHVTVNNTTGEISYDYKYLKNTSLQGLNLGKATCPEDEAQMLINKMRKGIKELKPSEEREITESIQKTLYKTNVNSFKLADLIIDRTQSGLDWRIDAAKDIADIEALRNSNMNFEDTWQYVIDFWKAFVQGVTTQNPNAYTVAEITDVEGLHSDGWGRESSKFPNNSDIMGKFLRETGMTSTANYSAFFTDLIKLFTKDFEEGYHGSEDANGVTKALKDKLLDKDKYLTSSDLNSIMYSYTFIGNHDKPRALHCAAMDMSMFYANLNDLNDYYHREIAYKLLKDKFFDHVSGESVNNYDFSTVSPKAIAMGLAIRRAAIEALNTYQQDNRISETEKRQALEAMSKAVADLSAGKFNGKHFDADAFGVKPFDVSIDMVIKQAKEKHGLDLPAEIDKHYSDDVFQKAIDPAISRLLGMMKYLVALPGMPTMFDGDDVGATGYDTKCKNMFLQGRQRIHHEWLKKGDKYKDFISQHHKEFENVMSVRKRPECNALNNGAPFMLPLQEAHSMENNSKFQIPAILRQSTDGRMAISLFNTKKRHDGEHSLYDYEGYYSPEDICLEEIRLNYGSENGKTVMMEGDWKVGITGLKEGTEFINANNSKDRYVVNNRDGKSFLKRTSGDGKIYINDSTLILYHVPPKTPLTFVGRYNVKPSINTIENAYCPENNLCGSKLLISK